MAQQQQQQYTPPIQPQRPYSPYQRTDSPHNGPPGPYAPPIKRQALSPNPQSPYGSPGLGNIQLPNQVFSAPYYGSQANGNPPYPPYNPNNHYGSPASATSQPIRPYGNQTSPAYSPNTQYSPNNIYGPNPNNVNGSNTNYNTMNAPSPAAPSQSVQMGGMGPPARPIDKPTDINELGDVMVGSGIDLREEEAALLNSYGKSGPQRQDAGYGANSFNNFGPSYAPPKSNFYSQNVPGDRNSFYGAGTFNQAPEPEKVPSTEEIAEENRRKALRRKAEIHSYHLNNPFLQSGCVHKRLTKQAHGMQVVVPKAGLLKSQPGHPARRITIQGPDKNEVLKVVQGEDILQPEAPLIELLSLLSLAAEERIRGLVEDAATLAKGRRVGSHGIVPADLVDLATGHGASETVAGLPTLDNSAVSPKSNPLKRSYAEANQPLTPVSANGQTQPSTAFGNPVAQALQKISKIERAHEEERLKKRQRRAAGDASRNGSTSGGTPGASGIQGEVAPEADSKKGTKAKEKQEASARKANEAEQHAATTKTMNLALGLSGAMGKKLSWMNKGADAGPSNPFLQKPNTNAQTPKAGASKANGTGSTLPKSRIFGEFREDREIGSGIQLRDIVSILENDGKEKKALQRAYGRMGKK